MEELSKIAENKVKSATSKEEVVVKSLWEEKACVITFFRRFGCAFCRLAAKDLSSIKSILDANNVQLIGIGVEELGVEDFINGKFFDGDLFIDSEKKCYTDLGYKRFGMLSIVSALATKTSRDAIFKARSENVGGDMKGDKYQVGGTLVISKGGKEVLLNHKQDSLADHVHPSEILKSLNLEAEIKNDEVEEEKPVTCNEVTCEASG
ncbi:hypothetical protein NPIL_414791 [Nephila pilipes]|uniref:Prostamide/prostaglandin F synthase n=1 Tax=Nephila pilipes TaxID=299642 RepID=A0A8X6JH03_NEPPI|nr:hypothetical protein NPIL_414791 [Nephila pilipes]